MKLTVSGQQRHLLSFSEQLPLKYQKYSLPGATVTFCDGKFGAFCQQVLKTLHYTVSYQCFWIKRKVSFRALFDKPDVVLNCMLHGEVICHLPDYRKIVCNEGKFDLHYIPGNAKCKADFSKGFFETIVIGIHSEALSLFQMDYPEVINNLVFRLSSDSRQSLSLDSFLMGINTREKITAIGMSMGGAMILFSKINEILLQYLNRLTAFQKDAGNSREFEISEIATYIDQNFQDAITVSNISRIYHTHISTIERLFKARYGTNIKRYLLKRRMEEAIKLLNSPGLSISEISFRTGFSDISYFSRVFRNTFHLSPSQYRTGQMKENA